MDKDLNNKLNIQNSNNVSYSNFNGIDFLETRNNLYLNNSDIENYDKIKNNNTKFTNVDNSKWNYDNQALRQNYDINISNEMNSSNINICDSNNIMNYQKKINNCNNMRQNNMAYLDSNTLNSNNIYNFNKAFNENNPFVIKSNTANNNMQKMNSQHFNVMKYSDYCNFNNCLYNTNILNTGISENPKNYSNNSSPYKNDYLKINLNSFNAINNNLNFSNASNSSNPNSNVFTNNMTTPSLNLMNYNPVNSCNIKYNSNMFDFTSTGNINSLKVKDFNLSELNPINFQESGLSNYSNINLKNVNFLHTPASSYNIISNNNDSNSFISSYNSKCLNSNFLKMNAINYNNSNTIKEKSNPFICSESQVFCSNKKNLLNEKNLNIEDEKNEKRRKNEKDTEEKEKDKEKEKKIRKNEKNEEEKEKRKKVHLINNLNIQKKKLNRETILKNMEGENKKLKKKDHDEDEDNDYIKESFDINKKRDLISEKENNMTKKNKNNKKKLANANKLLNIKVKNSDFPKESHEINHEGAKMNSTEKNEKNIIINKGNSNILRKIIDFENIKDTESEKLPSKKKENIKQLKEDNTTNLVKKDTIKDRLRSSAGKNSLKKNQRNGNNLTNQDNNVKSLSKYDFLMNRSILFKSVSIGNKKAKSSIEESYGEKHCNILEEKNKDINEKKRKFRDNGEMENNLKDEKIESFSKNEKKIKKNKDCEDIDNKKVINNKNNEIVYDKKRSLKNRSFNERKKEEKGGFKIIEKKKTSKAKKKNSSNYINNKEDVENTIKDCEQIEEISVVEVKSEKKKKIGNIKKEKCYDNKEERRRNGKMKNKRNSEKIEKEKSKFYKLEEEYNEKTKEELKNIANEKKKKKIRIKNLDEENHMDMIVKDKESIDEIVKENRENEYKKNENEIINKEDEYINIENYKRMKGKDCNIEYKSIELNDSNENKIIKEENECPNVENKIIYKINEFTNNENKVLVKENEYEYEYEENNKIIENNEYKNNENEIITKENETLIKEHETLIKEHETLIKEHETSIKENKNKNNENENLYLDINDICDTKEGILEKDELKINGSNNKYHTANNFNIDDNKCDLNDSLNIKKNKCDINNAKYAINSLKVENNMNSNLNKINDMKRKVIIEKERDMYDKDNYQITKSVIDENVNSNLFCNYDKKNSVKDLTRDLYSSTDGNNDIINNKKKKFWSNLGSISYMNNFVGKGSYGSVRKVLYNIDLNNDHLKFYIDKINSREFINLLLESSSVKNNSKFDEETKNALYDKKDITIFENGTKHIEDKKKGMNNCGNMLLTSKQVDNCLCCYNKRYFELAIKEIDVSRKGNEFQFLREQELLCHFNSNVIKPLSTKIGNLKEKQNYEILMHCANGDLRKLLQNLIYHRKKEFEKRKKINKILKLIHIIFGRKYKCYRSEDDNSCIGLCYEKLKKIKMKLNNSIIEIKYPKFDRIYDNIKVYNCGLTESECKFLFFQIVNGISFIQTCYQSNIIRVTDIKLQNILVYTDVHNLYNPMKWHLCISDFGCSAMEYATFYLENSKNYINVYKTLLNQWKYQFKNQLSSYFQGTVYTMAPEGLCYDHKGNFRQSKYNKLIYFYEQNFGNIENRFQELQKPLVSIKNALNNFNILNINSSSNFHFLNEKDEKLNDNSSNNNNKEEKKITDNKDYSKKSNLFSDIMNMKNKNNDDISNEKNKNNEKNNNNNSTEYLPFDVRCDSWSLGIILADLGKCGISSYEYMVSEKLNEESNNTLIKGKNIDLDNIILNDLNVSDDEEIFYLKYIMNYYDIVNLEWNNKEIENEKMKKEINKNEKKGNEKGNEKENEKGNIHMNNLNNNYVNKRKDKNVDDNIILNKNYSIDEDIIKDAVENELLNKDYTNDGNKKSREIDFLKTNDSNKEKENKSTLKNISIKDKKNGDNNLENLELFTKHYKLFMLKYKGYLRNEKAVTIKNEFIKYYKMNKHILNESNIDKTLLLLFLIINNNLSYNYNYEVQSFLKIELTIKNLGSGIFKFRSKKEKEQYLQEFKLNVNKEYMNGNKEYWHSRLTNKYLAIILKDICHDNFTNRKKNIKKCFNKFEYPLNYSDDYWSLLTDLLNYVPYERLLACEIIGHDFFSAPNEKIKNIKFENINEYNELYDKKEFRDILLRNYLQEKKEKKYLYKLLHEESEIDYDNSDNRKDRIKKINKGKKENSSLTTQLGNNSNKKKGEKELLINKYISNEIHNNQTNNFIASLYDTIIGNMKNKCGFCDNISDCLNYKNILRKIEHLENSITNIKDNNKNILNENHKKNKFLYPSNICNNVYYFLNEFSIYNELKNLNIFMNIHLPFEHLCLPICDEKTIKNKCLINFFFKPIYYYSFPYKVIHAWYIGPLHIYLNHPNIPDYIKLICLRESNVLRRKEIIFWCSEDIIFKNILKIKNLLSCSNDFLCTPYVSHIIGKQLIMRKKYLLKLFKKKII